MCRRYVEATKELKEELRRRKEAILNSGGTLNLGRAGRRLPSLCLTTANMVRCTNGSPKSHTMLFGVWRKLVRTKVLRARTCRQRRQFLKCGVRIWRMTGPGTMSCGGARTSGGRLSERLKNKVLSPSLMSVSIAVNHATGDCRTDCLLCRLVTVQEQVVFLAHGAPDGASLQFHTVI